MAWALELQAGINHSPLSCVSRGILSTAEEKKPRHMESAEATVAKFVLPNQQSRWQEKECTVPAGTGASHSSLRHTSPPFTLQQEQNIAQTRYSNGKMNSKPLVLTKDNS